MIEAADKLVFDFAAIVDEQDVSNAARTIKVPTLLFSGGRSPELPGVLPASSLRRFLARRPSNSPAAGHLMAISHARRREIPKLRNTSARSKRLATRIANMSKRLTRYQDHERVTAPCQAAFRRRHAAGGIPTIFLKARVKAASNRCGFVGDGGDLLRAPLSSRPRSACASWPGSAWAACRPDREAHGQHRP